MTDQCLPHGLSGRWRVCQCRNRVWEAQGSMMGNDDDDDFNGNLSLDTVNLYDFRLVRF